MGVLLINIIMGVLLIFIMGVLLINIIMGVLLITINAAQEWAANAAGNTIIIRRIN
jgi:hypothetical protein